MSSTFGQVKARVRSLLDDPQGSYLTDDFVTPLINQIYEDLNTQLLACLGSWDINVIEVTGIPPGFPNLQEFQQAGQPLAGLTEIPIRIDWKVSGNPPSTYQLVRNYEVLPDVQPQQGMAGWEWRRQVIWLTPSSIEVDLRIRGEFGPAPLVDDADVLISHPNIGYVVAYGTSALIGTVRGNQAWTQQYESKAVEGLDEIMADITRGTQGTTRRVGRMVERGGRNWTAQGTN